MTKVAPAFMFYASDAIADKRYRLMSLQERGLLLSLLCECWVNRSMPTSPADIAKWLGFPPEEIKQALTDRVLSYFDNQGGELVSPDLERYRNELEERRKKMSNGGKSGAAKKWKQSPGQPSYPNSPPNGVMMGSRVEMSREEKSKGESLESEVALVDKGWINDYERVSRGG